jgi:hypothetical protein
MANAGFGPVGIGTAKLARGSWETYVEKVDDHLVYVKMTSGKLDNLSIFTSVSIMSIGKNYFNSADDGFSYLFDMRTEVGRKAYEDMIRGNSYAAEQFATNKPKNLVEAAPVMKVMTFRTVSTGQTVSKAFAIPIIWDRVFSKGRVQSFTTSNLYLNRNTAKVHYGIFNESDDSRFWFKHREEDFMFTGAKYSVENWDSKERMDGMFGNYAFAFRHEKSSDERLRKGLKELVRKTGLKRLMINIPDNNSLGYTGVEFNAKMFEENTMRLMAAAQRMSESEFVDRGMALEEQYFNRGGDPWDICKLPGCEIKTRHETSKGMSKMYSSLRTMYKNMTGDPRAFAAAYGAFGEGMATNPFTFQSAMSLAGPGVLIDFLVEGTKISMYYKQWVTDSSGKWVPADKMPDSELYPKFEPRTRHSKIRGVVIGNNPGDMMPHDAIPLMQPVSFQ